MKYQPYPHEAMKRAVAGAMGPARLDFTKFMGDELSEEERANPELIQPQLRVNRQALVAALGMNIRSGGTFSRFDIAALQRRAAQGDRMSMNALRAMQEKRPIDRTKHLGVILWQIKYGGKQGEEVFRAAAHILAGELRRKSKDKRRLGPAYIAVMQCALTEWLHDRCEPCTGTGQTGRSRKQVGRNHPPLYVCTTCGGTGAYAPGTLQRADALHMDVATFMKKWEKRYDRVLAMLQRVDRTTGNSIDKQVHRAHAVATDRSHEQ